MARAGKGTRRLVDLLYAVDRLGGRARFRQLAEVLGWKVGTLRFYLHQAIEESYITSEPSGERRFKVYVLRPVEDGEADVVIIPLT